MSTDLIPAFLNPLEDLLIEALAHATPPKHRRVRNAALDPKETSRLGHHSEVFSNPENWTRTRGVALIHRETNTLLGNFSEYVHSRDRSARKLVRETEPLAIEGSEWVSGPLWLEWPADIPSPERQVSIVECLVDLYLPELGVRSLAVGVDVTLSYGGIAHVTLRDATYFVSDDRRSAFRLPKGLDVLEGLSLDCKLALRAEVGL